MLAKILLITLVLACTTPGPTFEKVIETTAFLKKHENHVIYKKYEIVPTKWTKR